MRTIPPESKGLSLKRPLEGVWKLFMGNRGRENMMQSMCLQVFYLISNSGNFDIQKTFHKIIKKHSSVIDQEKLLREFKLRYEEARRLKREAG